MSKGECCANCGGLTGRAGKGDDSLYDSLGNGPLCDECWDDKEPGGWAAYRKEKARADKLQEKLDRLYDSGLDGPQLIDDSQAFGDRIDEFRGDQSNPLTLTEQRELAQWWAERGTLVMDLDDRCCTEMARAEKAEEENAEYKRHLGNALYQAKEVCPDYPWSASPTMSEIAWAVCSTLEGAGLACDDWAADAKRLRETLGHIIIEAEQAMSVVPGAADALAAKPKAPSEVEGEDKHDA